MPEAANNPAAQTSFIPLLTLGSPLGAVMALMLGALMMQGSRPGPQVMRDRPDLFWGMVASMWVGNLMLVVLNLPLVGIWVKLLTVPYRLLFPGDPACSAASASTASTTARWTCLAPLRLAGLYVEEARVRARAAAAGLRTGTVDGREPAPRLLISRGEPDRVRDPADCRPVLMGIAALLLVLAILPSLRE